MSFNVERCIFMASTINGIVEIAEGCSFLMDCCFFDKCDGHTNYRNKYEPYTLTFGSVNRTCESNCGSGYTYLASHLGAIDHMTIHQNNNSHMTTTNLQCTFTMMRIPQNRDDVACFNQGINCQGNHGLALHSDKSNCIFCAVNLINTTISSGVGYFRCMYAVPSYLKNMCFVTQQPVNAMFAQSLGSLLIVGSFFEGKFIVNKNTCSLVSCTSTTDLQTHNIKQNRKCIYKTYEFTIDTKMRLEIFLLSWVFVL